VRHESRPRMPAFESATCTASIARSSSGSSSSSGSESTSRSAHLLLLVLLLAMLAVHVALSLAAGPRWLGRRSSPSGGHIFGATRARHAPPPARAHGPPPSPPAFLCNCSSLSSNSSRRRRHSSDSVDTKDLCCQRLVLRAHKMGVYLIKEYFGEIPSAIIHPDRLRGRLRRSATGTAAANPLVDYRHVVVTRPWYDAIVSGYLYHTSPYGGVLAGRRRPAPDPPTRRCAGRSD
jgi:hypothetical protein